MREIIEISNEKIEQMHYFYDSLMAGICIQKYIETEDGKGDFIPIYANAEFAKIMGVPSLDYIYMATLRQASQEFPEKQLEEMVDVAFNGRTIIGDSFASDFSKYFSVKMYQYQYGYTIMFISDVTAGHISSNSFAGVSKSYDAIYYASLSNSVCGKVYPASLDNISGVNYDELVKDIFASYEISQKDLPYIETFFKRENVAVAIEDEDSATIRFRRKIKEGKYRWYAIEIIVNEREDNIPTTFVITIKDIQALVREEKKRQEELEAAYENAKNANESKDRFLAHMSHDLRTPINGILGMIQILESTEASDELRADFRKRIRHNSENLLLLFNSVLNLTKLDSNDLKLEKRNIDFDVLKNEFEMYALKQNVDIKVEVPSFIHPMRLGPEELLRQIVFHLVMNSIKFNKDNNPIEFKFFELEDSDKVCMIVKDQGIGMSKEFLPHAFEAFSQEHGDSRTDYEGAGLGLTYIKRIIELMNGSIEIDSIQGEGTTVTVILPLEIDYDSETFNSPDKTKATLDGKRALIVEDNEVNMLVVTCFMALKNISYVKAENGKIAYDTFVNSKPGEFDFILMDIMMPVMNGLEATKLIRESNHPDAKTIPIIAVSANSFPTDIEKGFEAGMTAYLSKPLNKNVLFDTLEQYI